MTDLGHPSLTDLRSVPVFEDLPQEQLEWLSSHMRTLQFEDAEVIAREGDPAEENRPPKKPPELAVGAGTAAGAAAAVAELGPGTGIVR